MKLFNTRNFWLLIALLFLAIAAKAHAVDDDFVLWLTCLCAICSLVHAWARPPVQIDIQKLMDLVQPPK